MLSLQWQKKYELGVEEIDLQHHFFLMLINRISREFEQTNDYDYCRSLIEELNAYARFHFVSEENMMLRAGYPLAEEHRNHHRKLMTELSNMEVELDLDRSEDNFNNMLMFLLKWFRTHTSVEDRQFADFLQQSPDAVCDD